MRAKWEDLTAYEKAFYGQECCGPGKFSWVLPQGPDGLYDLGCCPHDFDYTVGGREWHRWGADFRMAWEMIKACFQATWWKIIPGLWAVPYYLISVLLFGWTRYEYRQKPLTLIEYVILYPNHRVLPPLPEAELPPQYMYSAINRLDELYDSEH